MRMLLKAVLDTEAANEVFRSGGATQATDQMVSQSCSNQGCTISIRVNTANRIAGGDRSTDRSGGGHLVAGGTLDWWVKDRPVVVGTRTGL
jgi:hypothetical protein